METWSRVREKKYGNVTLTWREPFHLYEYMKEGLHEECMVGIIDENIPIIVLGHECHLKSECHHCPVS